MTVVTFKKLWKNEYFQTVIMFALIMAIVFGLFFGAQVILGTEYPALAVASTSMLPTLNVGDLIIVQKADPAQLNADYVTGDIVVFKNPFNPEKLIVHRVVKVENKSDGYSITTHGDNVPGEKDQFSPWSSKLLVGKVIMKVPYIGHLPLFIHAERNIYLSLFLIIILIFILTMLPFGDEEEEKHEGKKLFGKVDIDIIYFLVLNFLIIGFLVFSLWGAFTFWQTGADPPQYVTIRGMYADLQYHESFNAAFLSQGFITYRIDCMVNYAIRPGVPTFSWMQASVLALIILNIRALINLHKIKEKFEKLKLKLKPI